MLTQRDLPRNLRRKFQLTHSLVVSPLIFAVVAFPAVSRAQGTAASQSATSSQSGGLEEIVVTAQKREEKIQDVPIVINAISAKAIEANHLQNTRDLQFLAPTLVYNELGGFAQPFLRGIGTDISSPDEDPSVATYIDGVFVADSQSTIQTLLGVERVEVLSGPQGTLYGRNALGGAINITTLTPKQDLEAHASLSGGNLGTFEGTARVSGGVTDDLALGLYLAGTRRDSIYSRPTVATQPDGVDNFGIRLKGVLDLSSAVRLTGTVDYLEAHSEDASAFRQGQTNAYGFVEFGAPLDVGPYRLQNDYPDKNVVRQFSTTLREEVDLDTLQILGISNYRQSQVFTQNDLDATSAPLYGSYADLRNRQYSQELQVISPKGEALEYIAGVYYFHQDGGEIPTVNVSDFLFLPAHGSLTNAQVKTESYAAFGQTTYSPIEDLRITLGARYTYETKRIYDGSFRLINANGGDFGPQTVYPDQAKTWEAFTPKVGVDYRIGGTLLYATYSAGFQSGAYNVVSPTDAPVNPEKLKSYEIGAKSDFLDGRLRLNLDAYYYDFSNLQVQIVTTGTGGLSEYKNAATAEAYGVEAYAQAALTPELHVTGQVAWEQTKYTKFVGYPVQVLAAVGNATVPSDVSGNPLQRAPKWVGSFALDYDTDISWGGELKADLSLYYNGGFPWDASNLYRQGSYALLNSAIGYTFPDDHWTVTLWGDNLTDENYQVARLPIVFGTLVTDGMPRTFGATVTFDFKGQSETSAPAQAYVPPPSVVPAPAVPKSYLVFFDFNKSDLTSQAVEIVDQAAKNAGPAHVTQITCTGHTDTVGSDAYNMRLSRRRAESVAAQLEKDGIPSSEIEIVAKGKRDLLVPTGDGVREPQNRRVQILYSGTPTS
jgi:iron complex outermembrane receptor protein